MSLFRVKYLCFFFALISVLSFFNIIYSYYFNFYLNLNTYYISLISSSLIAILFYKIKTEEKKPTIFEKILTVFLGYILLPLILSIPFYFSIYNLTFLNSIFESVKYRNIGPFRGGRSVAATGVVGDPMTYYMGNTGGGLWKTEDGGQLWKNISDGYFKTSSVGAVAVSESD